MFRKCIVGIAALAILGGAAPIAALAQESSATQNSAAELEAARQRMEEARRELEKAAREVGELSGRGNPYYIMGMRGPMQSELGITIEDGERGVRVTGVTPNGPAAKAGIAVDDVITAIDSTSLTAGGDRAQSGRLVEHMSQVSPGQNVVLHIERGGAAREISVTAREPEQGYAYRLGPNRQVFVRGFPEPATIGPGASAVWVGPGMRFDHLLGGLWNELELVTLTPALGSYFGATEGLLVVRAPDDPAIGLQGGDVILEIGGREPTSPEHALRILMSFEPGETITFAIMRRQRRETVEYVIPASRSEGL